MHLGEGNTATGGDNQYEICYGNKQMNCSTGVQKLKEMVHSEDLNACASDIALSKLPATVVSARGTGDQAINADTGDYRSGYRPGIRRRGQYAPVP